MEAGDINRITQIIKADPRLVGTCHVLQWAVSNQHEDIVRLILTIARGNCLDGEFNAACRHENLAIVSLLKRHCSMTTAGYGLETALKCDNTKVVEFLLDTGIKTDDMNHEFMKACCSNNIEIVKSFLRRIDPAHDNNIAFRMACQRRRTPVLRLLLELPPEQGINPAACDNTSFRFACWNGYTEIVRLLA